MTDMRLAVVGAAGRMGRQLVTAAHETAGLSVVGGIEREGSDAIGRDVGEVAGVGVLGGAIVSDPLELFTQIDGVLDFSTPATSVAIADLAAQARIVHVIGTTGFTAEDEERLAAAARHATLVKAGNMSLGVNLLVALTRKVAEALGPEFDIEVVEMHHRAKVDAPSGTALMLGAAAADGRGVNLEERAVRVRDGQTGPRVAGDIGFATLRGGGVVGDHTVIFAGDGERIELTHKAGDRSLFAQGAVRAALWGRGKGPGLFAMVDVLGL